MYSTALWPTQPLPKMYRSLSLGNSSPSNVKARNAWSFVSVLLSHWGTRETIASTVYPVLNSSFTVKYMCSTTADTRDRRNIPHTFPSLHQFCQPSSFERFLCLRKKQWAYCWACWACSKLRPPTLFSVPLGRIQYIGSCAEPQSMFETRAGKENSYLLGTDPCLIASSQSLNWLIDSWKRRARKSLYMSKKNRSVVDSRHILLWLWGTNGVWETALYNKSKSLLRCYTWRFHLQN